MYFLPCYLHVLSVHFARRRRLLTEAEGGWSFYLAWASSRLWSVMVIICCKMSPMSCFLPSPSVPPVPSCMCCGRPGCPAMPTPVWECINLGCSSISSAPPAAAAASLSLSVSLYLILCVSLLKSCKTYIKKEEKKEEEEEEGVKKKKNI